MLTPRLCEPSSTWRKRSASPWSPKGWKPRHRRSSCEGLAASRRKVIFSPNPCLPGRCAISWRLRVGQESLPRIPRDRSDADRRLPAVEQLVELGHVVPVAVVSEPVDSLGNALHDVDALLAVSAATSNKRGSVTGFPSGP